MSKYRMLLFVYFYFLKFFQKYHIRDNNSNNSLFFYRDLGF